MRVCTIEIRHTFEPADDIGNMRAKDTAIGVGFIDDDKAQVGEEVAPVGVMRQDARVKHVGIGQNDARILADGGAVFLRSVAIIDGSVIRFQDVSTICKLKRLEIGELILRKGFGGEEIKARALGSCNKEAKTGRL